MMDYMFFELRRVMEIVEIDDRDTRLEATSSKIIDYEHWINWNYLIASY